MSSTTQSVWGEARWIVKAPKSKSKKPSARVYTDPEMKVLLAPSRSDWADEEPLKAPEEQAEQISAPAANPKLNAWESGSWRRPEQVRVDALNIIAEGQKQAHGFKGLVKAQAAANKPSPNRRPRRFPTLEQSEPVPHVTVPIPAPAPVLVDSPGPIKSNPWTNGSKKQADAAPQNKVIEAIAEVPKSLKAPEVQAMPVARPQKNDREPWRKPAGWNTPNSTPVPGPAPKVPATPAPKNGNRWSKNQRKAKAEKNATKPQTAPVEKPILTDAPVKPSVWSKDVPVTAIFKLLAVASVEPAKQTVVFNMQVAVEVPSPQSVETVRPRTPVKTAEEGVVVKLPSSPPQSATPATPERQTVAVKLPSALTPPSSPPRKAVSPVIPVIPRSFERTKFSTPPPSEAQPKSLETSRGTEESSNIIVADSACSPYRSRASSIVSEETVIITDSSQSLNPRPVFMRRDSEVHEHDQWFCPLNGPSISPLCGYSPKSNGSNRSNLSPTAEPFVPRGQMEQHTVRLGTSPRCSPGHNHSLPDPPTSPLELSPEGVEVAHPGRPVLGLSIPPTGVIQPHPYPHPHQYFPPRDLAAPPAPTPTPEYLDVLLRERNRLDMILIQDDLVRDIEDRAAKLALRGLYPDGTTRDPLQVEAWEIQQQMYMHQRFH
ncbi:hypothetical protein DL98DRAFT_539482 [Cadophora sp. DSE1049]|nr:hypothetical protein DL98DRAFT_539482 [Cadophora sp. DSE1049]